MSKQHRRRFRRANKTGRSTGMPKFVMLWHHVLDSDAYLSLKPVSRAAYTLLRRRFNGSNNGEILCSIRDIALKCRCSKDGATAALRELQRKGFIKCAQPGSFTYKIRHAAKWILTEEEYRGEYPTKEFMRWKPVEKNTGPENGTGGPDKRTGVLKEGPNGVAVGPKTGTERAD